MNIFRLLAFSLITAAAAAQNTSFRPLKIGIAGLTHTHVHWIFASAGKYPDKFRIVGIAEPNGDLAERYLKQYGLSPSLLFKSLEEMVEKTKPEAVTAFNSIAEHLDVVRVCAPKKIHVMVEKPLAVNLKHAMEMQALAREHGIYLLTNYETTWYASHHHAQRIVHQQKEAFGDVRKIVVHDGHPGPKEIGVNQEFLQWLTDPQLNGGGAIMDFGCYGANLITWLMNGARPESVMAVTQQLKPDLYPNVDDEATIIVTYPKAQGIIQASWNWPYNRKDIEVYGGRALLKADRSSLLLQRGDDPPSGQELEPLPPQLSDPFLYLAAVIRGDIEMSDTDLSSLPLNITVMEILDAAITSASEGRRVYLRKLPDDKR